MRMTADEATTLDRQEQVARIERAQEKTRKFAAEQHKLAAEAAKLRVDRFATPLVILGSLGSGVVGAVLAHFWH